MSWGFRPKASSSQGNGDAGFFLRDFAHHHPYWFATGSVACALGLRLSLNPWLELRSPYPLLLVAVALSALYAGTLPSVFTVVLAAAGANYFLVPPLYHVGFQDLSDVIALGGFLLAASLIIVMGRKQAVTLERARESLRELRQTERDLRDSRSLLQGFLDNSPGIAYLKDERGSYVYQNQMMRILAGSIAKSREKAGQILPADAAPRLTERDAEVLRTGKPVEFIDLVEQQDGIHHWRSIKFPFIDQSGQKFIGMESFDITDRVQAQQKVESAYAEAQKLSAQLRGILDSSPIAIVACNVDDVVWVWNRAAEAIFGWKTEEVAGLSLPLPEREKAQWGDLKHRLLQGKTISNVASTRLRKSNTEFPVSLSGAPIRDREGAISGFVVLISDSSEQVKAEKALQESEKRRVLAVETAQMGSWRWNLETGQVELDANCRRMFGVSATEIPNFSDLFSVLHPDDRERTRRGLEQAVANHTEYDGLHRVIWPDGSIRWLRCTGRLLNEDHPPKFMAGMGVDVTWMKREPELMFRNKVLTTAAELASVLAHEINNPLQTLGNSLHLAGKHPVASRELLFHAQQAFERVSYITQQMLALYTDPSFASSRSDVCQIVKDVIADYQAKGRIGNRSVKTRSRHGSAEFYGLGADIRHLISNLLDNALESLGEKGVVVVHTDPCCSWLAEGRLGVQVVVADNGPGIPPELRRRVFQPFVTTKEKRAAGLGLWVCQAIAKKYEGSIRLRSSTTPGRSGTCISVFLPLQRPPFETGGDFKISARQSESSFGTNRSSSAA